MNPVNSVASADGTTIAFEKLGAGEPIILVGAALCDRNATRPLAEQLARHRTVLNYDRRGRGDSGDTQPYAVEREIEDIAALITEAGGTASVYGHSSGAGLALHAAAHGLGISELVLHEPPFEADDEEVRRRSEKDAGKIAELLAQDRREDALELMLSGTGMPPEMVRQLSTDPAVLAMAHTLLYDFAAMHDAGRDGRSPEQQAGDVRIPTLVLAGEKSPQWMIDVGRRVAAAMPEGRHQVLAGQDHFVPPEVLAPVLTEFLTG
ncbi:Pimeloyl-ACP methyl ester carboxylesterase [Amycolatopsis marina]|uniref:Pimeloyl-ACP methyl ester carboxylesterase n=1 Tax=Amycolatopsis marina TaxID=490629 RepID=A0A1I1B463_9PSEU|nr:alpha/beta hydrolase [Amycolatopsis marina]SFB44436.1 Pimeloyl-ACP methyl ester carboxylesterase [Amycolatopsis marina]